MQNKKSKVLVIALIVSLIAIISIGSLAWFTAKDEVTNTIKLADNFDVDVYETDKCFRPIIDGGETVGQTYTGIMPGQTLKKDPTVKNTGAHPEWIRVKVTLSSYKVWETKLAAGTDLTTIFGGYKDIMWTRYDDPEIDEEENTVTYTFYLNYVLYPGQIAKLFDSVTIPAEVDQDDISDMNGTFTIKIAAEAIQAENLPKTVKNALDAFALLDE